MSETYHDHQENRFRSRMTSSKTVRDSTHRRSSYSSFGCVPEEIYPAAANPVVTTAVQPDGLVETVVPE